MRAEATQQIVNNEVLAHGTKVGVHVVARVVGGWRYVGREFDGQVVGSHTVLPKGVHNVLPDRPLPLDEEQEYRDSAPVIVSPDEPIWHRLDERYAIEVRRIVIPEIVVSPLAESQPDC